MCQEDLHTARSRMKLETPALQRQLLLMMLYSSRQVIHDEWH